MSDPALQTHLGGRAGLAGHASLSGIIGPHGRLAETHVLRKGAPTSIGLSSWERVPSQAKCLRSRLIPVL